MADDEDVETDDTFRDDVVDAVARWHLKFPRPLG
jgi:hypothetical protein